MTPPSPPLLDWGWVGAALEGPESGDLHLVIMAPDRALVALIDGLGHGPEAAEAAREAAALLKDYAALPLDELVQHCHEGLRKTRGVVMSLAAVDRRSSTLEWCGVGNVEGVLFRADATRARPREALTSRGGVVGYRLPPLKVTSLPLYRNDVLVLATDGIRSDFADAVDDQLAAQAIADAVFERCAKSTDDALVLAVRYLGALP
jgi:phosphoserine phosphatase RsbX